MPEIIDLVDTASEDELDLLSPASSTAVGSGSATPTKRLASTPSSTTRVLRSRISRTVITVSQTSKKTAMKRKRPIAEDVVVATAVKKLKTEHRKQNTVDIHKQKLAIEAVRRQWIHVHRDIFAPLLPSRNEFLAKLKKEISGSGTCVPFHEIVEQPELVVGGQLKDYQLHGLSFLAYMHHNGMNCILGDEMGLGKTLQTLSLFAYIKENSKGKIDPHLIICPLSVVETWIGEIARWLPSFRSLRFHAQQSERTRLKNLIRFGELEFDICVTTYEGYVAEDPWFKSQRWNYVVLDEGHKIKNTDTIVAHKLQGIGSLHRLVLTGTPVQNNLVELWGLLHWLYPAVFTAATEQAFKQSFDLTKGSYSIPFLAATEKLLSKVMLRRTKDTVVIQVPPREEHTLFIPMSEAQRFWTYRLLTKLDTMDLEEIFHSKLSDDKENEGRQAVKAHLTAKIEEGKSGQENRWRRLMNLLMQLRKVCDHPYLLPDAEPSPYSLGEHVVASSSKLILLDKLLADILPKGEKVLIFTQWTGMLDLLEDFLGMRDITYSRFDGSTPRPRRTLDIKLFQQEVSPYQVMLISTKAGGLGINLTKASTVIMFDSDWNPQNDLQAIARAHRIGQKNTVKVYRLICQGSVEDQMLDRIRRKLFLSIKIMNSHSDGKEEHNPVLKKDELLSILRKGSSALSRTDGNVLSLQRFLSAPIHEILEVSRSRDDIKVLQLRKDAGDNIPKADQQLQEDAEEEERRLLNGIAQVQSRLFEGKVIERPKANKDIAEEWRALQKRASQKRIVTIDGFEVLAEHLGPDVTATPAKKPQKKTRKFEWEDWCIYCRDGGELALCSHCPRVFHPQCHGLSAAAVARLSQVTCPQHQCGECSRNTTDAGGMLFKCQTCPNAFCEDCLPPGEIDAVGATLPEFVLRNYGEKSTAYYVRCQDCTDRFASDRRWARQWEEEFADTARQLEASEA